MAGKRKAATKAKAEPEKDVEENAEEVVDEPKKRTAPKRAAKAKPQVVETPEEEEEEDEKPKKGTKKAPAKRGKKQKTEEDEEDEEGEEKADPAEASVTVQTTDFTLPKKDEGHIKISSWNVAGWKAIQTKGFLDYVKNEDPDIICVQETKVAVSAVKADFIPGYESHFNECKAKNGYSGTGIFTKIKPLSWTDGINISDHDEEGRVITAEFQDFYLVNTYIPNSGRGLKDLDYRKKWDADFLNYLKTLDAKKPVIWCGDLNVAHQAADLTNPKPNYNKTAGYSQAEIDGFTAVLNSGFVDSFRHFSPEEKQAFTFWSFMRNARAKNIGWRLDYFVVSKRLMDKVAHSYRRPHVMGSDHCPIVLHGALK
eukprot:TRINITY_DN1544_c0_g1_i3.p1 TRINITY_DN1544_c0_g1~~TRINITY_DN1544_c0_g1_i3.p1  ORF type:complete len:369 (-),score=116.98 TRINITY_DN1544_c0_g1_i3:113-1219(-)